MKFVIVLVFTVFAVASSFPLGPSRYIDPDDQSSVAQNNFVSLNRVRRQGGDYIKAGAAHSSKYGGGGQILVNKNLASSKHHSVDAQAKYNQFGKHKEGWAGINYSLRF